MCVRAHGPWLTRYFLFYFIFSREDKGQLYMWGSSEAGRLGDGRSTEGVTRTPKLVPAFADIHQARCLGVSIGPRHALAISSTSSQASATATCSSPST
jgi:alpha-tubulin suppressor-like RCC1 family protein